MKICFFNISFFLVIILLSSCSPSRKSQIHEEPLANDKIEGIIEIPKSDVFMANLLAAYPQYFDSILKNNDKFGVQIIYTSIDRGKNGNAKFTDHFYQVDNDKYFYPASTVKLPVAILALQKLNGLNIPGLDKFTTIVTETDHSPQGTGSGQSAVYNDPTTADGRPTIAHYIKKILLVSDNDAFNRLYEFLGQEYINSTLHNMGYTDVQIIHRLDIALTEEENRRANPIKFYNNSSQIIYEKPGISSQLVYANRNTKLGKGYMNGGSLVNEPFDFSKKNRLPLKDLHQVLRSLLFPKMVTSGQRFNLNGDDYEFLRRYMSTMPQESKFPFYDSSEYQDTYAKFLLYGAERGAANPDIRIFNKVGDAYGFMIDAAYIVDYKNNIEFMLSAVIHCNSDGIFNDDQYEYATVGYPFMKNLGKVIYEYELKRERKYKPDLSYFKFDY